MHRDTRSRLIKEGKSSEIGVAESLFGLQTCARKNAVGIRTNKSGGRGTVKKNISNGTRHLTKRGVVLLKYFVIPVSGGFQTRNLGKIPVGVPGGAAGLHMMSRSGSEKSREAPSCEKKPKKNITTNRGLNEYEGFKSRSCEGEGSPRGKEKHTRDGGNAEGKVETLANRKKSSFGNGKRFLSTFIKGAGHV